ncbi:hypothetical protein [Actinomadura fibrosa]|uniref:Uncharacterized protein n=1 Tax=Actinomadura fibrosa TaxID=111802 RepID=A0ABW2XXD9_9ACTN|nr:hypothetical protein [Actinomadura fibrosa]
MQAHLDYAIKQIKAADNVPNLLVSAFTGLELIERATTVLAGEASETAYPAYRAALDEASESWWALSEAPTLAWLGSSEAFTADLQDFADSIARLVMVSAEAIMTVASKTTDPADRAACLRAAHHAGHIYAALK